MNSAYDHLIATGAIGSLKRDILLEASEDVYYLVHLRNWFEEAGEEGAAAATACTVRVVCELVGGGLCRLATWGGANGSIEGVDLSEGELAQAVESGRSAESRPFDYFLTATDAGHEWVARYRALVAEL